MMTFLATSFSPLNRFKTVLFVANVNNALWILNVCHQYFISLHISYIFNYDRTFYKSFESGKSGFRNYNYCTISMNVSQNNQQLDVSGKLEHSDIKLSKHPTDDTGRTRCQLCCQTVVTGNGCSELAIDPSGVCRSESPPEFRH